MNSKGILKVLVIIFFADFMPNKLKKKSLNNIETIHKINFLYKPAAMKKASFLDNESAKFPDGKNLGKFDQ